MTADQGYPSGLVTSFNPATDNITWIPKNTPGQLCRELLPRRAAAASEEYAAGHRIHRQPRAEAARLPQCQPEESRRSAFARPFATGPATSPKALNEFYSHYNALQVRYEQRFVARTDAAELVYMGALAGQRQRFAGRQYSISAGWQQHCGRTMGSRTTTCPSPTSPSLVYELPFGHGRHFLANANGLTDSIVGGWQISGINTMQAGTPFNITYSPNCGAGGITRRFRPRIGGPTNTGRILLPGNP